MIGLSLSVLGSGGSIITVPVLVYAARQTPQNAVPMSLAIVGGVSALGALFKNRSELVHWKAVLTFGAAGMAGAIVGARGTHLVSARLLLLIFAGVMLVVAANMWRRVSPVVEGKPQCSVARCVPAGFAVGALTGFLGVGGGFLLVPALAYFARLTTPVAIGTSLAIIAMNSLGGLLGHWAAAGTNWRLTLLFLGAALIGMIGGLPIGSRISGRALNRGFAVFVIVVAIFVLSQNIALHA